MPVSDTIPCVFCRNNFTLAACPPGQTADKCRVCQVADTVYLGCTVTGVVGEEGKAALGAAGRLLLPRLGA